MIKFPFIGGTYPNEPELTFCTQRTVNLYPEHDPNYEEPLVLEGFPGYSLWTPLNDGPVRGSQKFKDHAIVVSKNVVYRVSKDGAARQVGSINTEAGRVSMDENGSQLMLVDGRDGWVWNGTTWQQITDSTFTDTKADTVTHMDSYFIVNKPGTGSIWVSDSFDGLNWNSLRTATAEFKSDDVVAVWADRELMLGGESTTQIYYNSGASPMPFEAARQGRIIYGLAARDSVAILDNTSHFLAQDKNGGVFLARSNGYSVERVSNRAWERTWSKYSNIKDAFAFAMQWGGHEWYVLTFDTADHGFGRTFVYDASTQLWFEVGIYRPSIGEFVKWKITSHVYLDGKHIVGDSDGNLNIVESDNYSFAGTTIIALRRSNVIHQNRDRIFFNALEINMKTGLETSTVSNPRLMLDISDDGGHTWKERRYKSLAGHGANKYDVRARFRRLGSSYDRVFQVSISDPVPRKFVSGFVE